MNRPIRMFLLLSMAVFGMSWGPANAADPIKLKVGAYNSVSDAPLYIAKDKGYFAEQGFDVEFVQVSSGAVMLTQLATGAMDASGGAPGSRFLQCRPAGHGRPDRCRQGQYAAGPWLFRFRRAQGHRRSGQDRCRPSGTHAGGHRLQSGREQ